jgi:hypothetical protein
MVMQNRSASPNGGVMDCFCINELLNDPEKRAEKVIGGLIGSIPFIGPAYKIIDGTETLFCIMDGGPNPNGPSLSERITGHPDNVIIDTLQHTPEATRKLIEDIWDGSFEFGRKVGQTTRNVRRVVRDVTNYKWKKLKFW